MTWTPFNELGIARGDMIANTSQACEAADRFAVDLIWLDTSPMLPERVYRARFAAATVNPLFLELSYTVEINTRTALRRSSKINCQIMGVDKSSGALELRQKQRILLLTELSGSDRTTIADLLERRLQALGKHTYLLDGANIRRGLDKKLGFTDPDRLENICRNAEVAKLKIDAGLVVIVSFSSPFRSEHIMARELVQPDQLIEVFIDAPLEASEHRDPKGLYAKARQGERLNCTGIGSPY